MARIWARAIFCSSLLVAALGCSAVAKKPQGAPGSGGTGGAFSDRQPALRQMVFRWPSPGVVRVSEATQKKGSNAELVYDLHICPTDAGFRVHYANLRFLSIAGVSANDPRIRDAIKPALALVSAIPDFETAKDGTLLRVVGIEATIGKILEEEADDEQRARMRRFFERPESIALLEGKIAETWAAWVQTWLPFDPSGEAVQSFYVDDDQPEDARGEPVDTHSVEDARVVDEQEQTVAIERVAQEGSLVRLRVVSLQTDERLKPMVMQLLLPSLGNESSAQEKEATIRSLRVQRRDRWEVLTDPQTLRPTEMDRQSTVEVVLPDGTTQDRFESHRYRFDWVAGAAIAPICDHSRTTMTVDLTIRATSSIRER